VAVEQNASQVSIQIEGFTVDGVDCGEWNVIATKISQTVDQDGS
jgi:hypothetical protein